jgi:hypothetical protein
MTYQPEYDAIDMDAMPEPEEEPRCLLCTHAWNIRDDREGAEFGALLIYCNVDATAVIAKDDLGESVTFPCVDRDHVCKEFVHWATLSDFPEVS